MFSFHLMLLIVNLTPGDVACLLLSGLPQLYVEFFLLKIPIDIQVLVQFIVMLFPNPISSRVLVRKTLAAIGGEVGNIFAVEIEAFLAQEARAANDDDQVSSAMSLRQKEKRAKKFEERLFAVAVSYARNDPVSWRY